MNSLLGDSVASPTVWIVTIVVTVGVLLVDLLIIARRPHEPSMKEVSLHLAFFVSIMDFATFSWTRDRLQIIPIMWDQKENYASNGFAIAFALNVPMAKVAKILAENRPGMIIWSMGQTQHSNGNAGVRANAGWPAGARCRPRCA